MKTIKRAQARILEWDLRGCVYLNHLSQRAMIALIFKKISRLGDGAFWVLMLLLFLSVEAGAGRCL